MTDVRHVTRHAGSATQRACIWCGPLVIVVMLFGMAVFPGFLPPPSAALTPEEIATVFRDHTTGIRIGMMLMVVGAAFLGVYFAVVSSQLRRIEGPRPTLTYAQLLLGGAFVAEIIFPLVAIQVAVYRPERADVLQQLLSDYGFLCFFSVASTAIVQFCIIGAAIMQDTRPEPVFPRWSGYLSIWAGLMFAPGTFCVFFKTGPLSWNGLFIFWVPFCAFFIWLIAMTRLLFRAVAHEEAEEAGGAEGDPVLAELGERVDRLTTELETMGARLAELEGRAVPR
jgi:hypothetical protein